MFTDIYDWLVTRTVVRNVTQLGYPAVMERRLIDGRQRWVAITTKRGWVYYRGRRVLSDEREA